MIPDRASPDLIHVVAGAVTRADGRVLIGQRLPGKHLAGGWEFPGGKLEPGEPPALGLARELREELGIAIREPRPLMRLRHRYPYGEVLIDMWVVSRYDGEPRGMDGQALRWCTQDELPRAELLPADRPLVRALRLPERLTTACDADYRVGGWRGRDRAAMGGSAAGDTWLRSVACADAAEAAVSAGDNRLRGASCANAAEAAAAVSDAAVSAGAEFLVVSAVLAPVELAALCRSVSVPVYARGLALEEAWAAGASGLNEIEG